MLLCEVALGNMYELLHAKAIEKLPKGKHSCKGTFFYCILSWLLSLLFDKLRDRQVFSCQKHIIALLFWTVVKLLNFIRNLLDFIRC